MIEEEITKVLKKRIRIADESHDEWDFGIQQCWDEETEILSRDMTQTINFIENECSDDTFCWLGEVFEDVAKRTQSKEFIAAIKNRAEKILDTENRRSAYVDISYAEDRIE